MPWIALFVRTGNESYPFLYPRAPNSAWHKGVLGLGAEILLVEANSYKVTLVHLVGKLGCSHMAISSALVTWHLSLVVVVLLLMPPMFWCHPISHRTYLLMQAPGRWYKSSVCSLLVKDGGRSGRTAVLPWQFGGTPCCPLTLTQVPRWIVNDGERVL